MAQERKHYPYRVAILYRPYFDEFYSGWDAQLKREFVEACKAVDGYLKRVPKSLTKNPYVFDCGRAMNYVLGRVTTIL